jgi:hypothetical protein
MTQAQKVFEAIMRTKGHMDFAQEKSRYNNSSLQTRWGYFQLGWEMAKVSNEPRRKGPEPTALHDVA